MTLISHKLDSHFYFLPKHHLFEELKNHFNPYQCDHKASRVTIVPIIITSKLLLPVILFVAAHIAAFSSCTDGPMQLIGIT